MKTLSTSLVLKMFLFITILSVLTLSSSQNINTRIAETTVDENMEDDPSENPNHFI